MTQSGNSAERTQSALSASASQMYATAPATPAIAAICQLPQPGPPYLQHQKHSSPEPLIFYSPLHPAQIPPVLQATAEAPLSSPALLPQYRLLPAHSLIPSHGTPRQQNRLQVPPTAACQATLDHLYCRRGGGGCRGPVEEGAVYAPALMTRRHLPRAGVQRAAQAYSTRPALQVV